LVSSEGIGVGSVAGVRNGARPGDLPVQAPTNTAKGDTAQITIRKVMQSNGVIHAIDTVLLPG
jgi:uncharacterized surface protein with fasciclin (FAS1) repeats